MENVHLETYLRLRQLELALSRQGALENFRDVAFNALEMMRHVSNAIDRYEIVYPELKRPSLRDN